MFAKYRRIQAVTELTDCLINITEAWRWLQIRDVRFSLWLLFILASVIAGLASTALSPGCHRVATHCWKECNNCTPNVKTWFTFLIPCYVISIWSYTSGSASFCTTQIQILISVFLSTIKLSRHIFFTCNVIKLPHLET